MLLVVPFFEISSIFFDVLTANLWNAGLQNHNETLTWGKPALCSNNINELLFNLLSKTGKPGSWAPYTSVWELGGEGNTLEKKRS
jgi:hypothetical protein